jgi:hypothetical protein
LSSGFLRYWLSNPLATLPLHGHIGFQGKHARAPIWFKKYKG